jgi:hypothetical protein
MSRGNRTPIVLCGALLASAGGCSAGLKEVPLDPGIRNGLSQTESIHSVTYGPVPLRVVRLGGVAELAEHAFGTGQFLAFADPVTDVESAFLDGLRGEMGLASVERSGARLSSGHVASMGADLQPLRATFRDGLVFDFETIEWRLAFVSRSFIDNTRTTYGIDHSVRARLVRLADATVVWQGICLSRSGDAPRMLQEFTADDFALLKSRRAEVADACAKELLGSFLGRTKRSMWSGRSVPK